MLDRKELKLYTRSKVKELSKEEYTTAIGKRIDDWNLKYEKKTISGIDCFYEYEVPADDELDTALIYKLCKSQDETNKHLKAIKGILIFFAALTIIGMIAAVVLLNK